ncbi:plastocyanin/azurin family copper-binding protein [Blastococcus sp. SYSU D00669]
MFHARRRSAAVVLAVALGALTACGGGDDEGGDAASGTTTTSSSSATSSAPAETSAAETSSSAPAETQALAVSSVDFDFEMDSTQLAAGEYEITLTNNGDATHDLVVERDGSDVAASEQIGPGESSTFTVTLEPGSYAFYCSIGNHRQMGMEVDVTVS